MGKTKEEGQISANKQRLSVSPGDREKMGEKKK